MRRDGSTGWTDDVIVMRALQTIALAWLIALGQPIGDLIRTDPSRPSVVLAMLGIVLFAAIYLRVVLTVRSVRSTNRTADKTPAPEASRWTERVRRWLPLAGLGALGVVYTVVLRDYWLDLLIFTGVAAAFHLPIRQATRVIPAVAVVAGALGLIVVNSAAVAAPAFLLILSVGIGVAGGFYAIRTVRELRAAREELARLAVAEERLRFARDLHDLLGHSLSLIALKSELAHELAIPAPERAAAEMRDVEAVAREALREVREAVAGYRQPALASELAAAAEILAAADVRFSAEGGLGPLPPQVEAALAWTVREGVTNVIRHSRARTCSIHLSRDERRIVVAVEDDGRAIAENAGTAPAHAGAGRSGLAGLAERVGAVGGRIEAGPRPSGGFRLVATVPLAESDRPVTPPDDADREIRAEADRLALGDER